MNKFLFLILLTAGALVAQLATSPNLKNVSGTTLFSPTLSSPSITNATIYPSGGGTLSFTATSNVWIRGNTTNTGVLTVIGNTSVSNIAFSGTLTSGSSLGINLTNIYFTCATNAGPNNLSNYQVIANGIIVQHTQTQLE